MLTQQVSVDPLFDHFDSEQHRLWKQHRLLRQRVPISHIWRGCLGLAMLLHDVECTEYPTDRHALLPNHAISWLALRDIPRNHFPMCPAMHRRDVQYVSATQASLHYGMPVLDFSANLREAFDFRFMPFGCFEQRQDQYSGGPVTARGDVLNSDEHPREFAVLNRLNVAMTRYAFTALDEQGRPIRGAWAQYRPADMIAAVSPAPHRCIPRPYLSFERRLERLLSDVSGARALRLESQPRQVLFSAQAVAQVAKFCRPTGLWWDVLPCDTYLDGQLEAVVLPPIPLTSWHRLRFRLPGEVLLNASIADPRFSVTMTPQQDNRPISQLPANSSVKRGTRPAIHVGQAA